MDIIFLIISVGFLTGVVFGINLKINKIQKTTECIYNIVKKENN